MYLFRMATCKMGPGEEVQPWLDMHKTRLSECPVHKHRFVANLQVCTNIHGCHLLRNYKDDNVKYVGIQFHYIKGHWQILLESVHGTPRASASM